MKERGQASLVLRNGVFYGGSLTPHSQSWCRMRGLEGWTLALGKLVSSEDGHLCRWGKTSSASEKGESWDGCSVGSAYGVTGLSSVHFAISLLQDLSLHVAGRSQLCSGNGV